MPRDVTVMDPAAGSPSDAECPCPEDLEAFCHGRLAGEHRARIAAHVERCVNCRSTYDMFGQKQAAAPAPPAASPTPEPADLRGARIDQYQLLEPIGGGGMGLVYKARHVKLQHIVALKMLAPSTLREPHAVKRFEREMA